MIKKRNQCEFLKKSKASFFSRRINAYKKVKKQIEKEKLKITVVIYYQNSWRETLHRTASANSDCLLRRYTYSWKCKYFKDKFAKHR